MSKKLKIQFWKAEKALAMQILEQEGLPECKEDGLVKIDERPLIGMKSIYLRGYMSSLGLSIPYGRFNSNTERDEYLQKIVSAITDELFTDKGELKIGEMCEVSDYEEHWTTRKLIAILPKKYENRFITEWKNYSAGHRSWQYARPITKRTEPKVEECGQLVTYTWEEE